MSNAITLKALQDNVTGELIPAYRDVTVVEENGDVYLIDLDGKTYMVAKHLVKVFEPSARQAEINTVKQLQAELARRLNNLRVTL